MTEDRSVKAADEGALAFLLPTPLRSRRAKEWVRSVTLDGVLIALNWFLLGAVAISLRPRHPVGWMGRVLPWSPVLLAGISILHAALITLVAYTEGLYAADANLRAQIRMLAKAILLTTCVLCVAYPLQGAPLNMAASFCLAGALHFGVLSTWRWWRVSRDRRAGRDIKARNVLIVGAGPTGCRIASNIEANPACGRRICGFVDDEMPPGDRVIGQVSDLSSIARRGFVDEIILAGPRNRDLIGLVLREAKRLHLDLQVVPDLCGCDPAESEIEQVGGLPVICIHAERLPSGALGLKRLIDLLGASVGLVLLLPLLLLIAAVVKMDSRGPALYVAQRAGRKGRLFRCYKFRTMVCDAERLKDSLRKKNERAGPIFKIAADPRITRIGRFLRHYSLDELPQLWNVLKGEMSLVGPRPHPRDEFAAYELSHLGRLDVTPGMTGLWQVSARRDPSFDRAMDLDREYIRTWSLGLDLRILLRTFTAVARGSGN